MTVAAGLRREVAEALDRRAERRWERAAEMAGTLDLSALESLRVRARSLRSRLDRALHLVEARLSQPDDETGRVPLPLHADWAWRPAAWAGPVAPKGHAAAGDGTEISPDTKLFHDCPLAECSLRQVRNTRPEDGAPYAVALDVLGFEGSFLSLAVELPPDGSDGLKRRHVVAVTLDPVAEQPLEFFARLNVRHGPNTEQFVLEGTLGAERLELEFDLGYSSIDEGMVTRAWVDLILESPAMNRVLFRDVTLSRRPRAEL